MHQVMIADDHALVRAGLRALIEGFDGFEVVAEAGDGLEAVRLAAALQPALVLVDIGMPGLNGVDALAQIRACCPGCGLLVVSMHADRAHVEAAFAAGANAYVLKESAPSELAGAMSAVMRGERHASVQLRLDLGRLGQGSVAARGSVRLSARQREILQLIAQGQATREIAAHLCISIKTVETHRAQLMQKLGIFDVAGLTRHAIRVGLVSLES